MDLAQYKLRGWIIGYQEAAAIDAERAREDFRSDWNRCHYQEMAAIESKAARMYMGITEEDYNYG